MGLIEYKFIKFWEVEKQISLERNATCLLVFEKNKLVFSLWNVLKLYDINRDQNFMSNFFCSSRRNKRVFKN